MVKLIAIVDEDFGIAKNGKIPWQFKDDLSFFQRQTWLDVVVMGRVTYFSIEKSLPSRINCIISNSMSSKEFFAKSNRSTKLFQTPEQALEKYQDHDIWIIGGAMLFNYVIAGKLINKIIITQVHRSYNADLFIDKSLLMDNFKFQRTIARGLIQPELCTTPPSIVPTDTIERENQFPKMADDNLDTYSIYEYNLRISQPK
ncbi:MAG: dihydrofolate reductase [Holosporaceae bacterium]|jgi:dihydrofolate reductase|nr:dihydrofolate reductase [Holosporaceae bacterium]